MQQEINKMIHICERLVALAVTPEQRAKAKANLYHNIQNKPTPPPFISTHNLPFEAAEFNGGLFHSLLGIQPDKSFAHFRIGTCTGLWRCKGKYYEILAVVNDSPGNGHFADVLEWFGNSCKRDKKSLVFMEVLNERFGSHLMDKHGFERFRVRDLIKVY